MKRPRHTIQYTVYDSYTLSPKEKSIYHAIVKETILKNKRCSKLSLSDLEEYTGIKRNTIAYQLKRLEKRRLIEVDRTQKTHTYCIVTIYKEYYRI